MNNIFSSSDKICIYLRKSRADEELEKTIGEGETLAKHRKALLRYAKENKLNIVEIKEELVSADSIFHRPKMVELLKEVESDTYTGVLVMDIQRLGRGDTEDQGIIARIFKESHTRILTPQKVYNLDDDYDEDYFEFESFMGRKEYKMIKKRMQGGRIRSVQDGNYIGSVAPFGYDSVTVNKSPTLKPNPDEVEIVKLIFKLYAEGNGTGAVANYLNSLGYKTRKGNYFERSTLSLMLKNPIYIGKVTWKKKEIKRSKNPNKKKDTRTRDRSEWIIAQGKHEPIIDEELFNRVQNIINQKYHIPYQIINGAANPLAGIVVCGVCGNKMVMRNLRGVSRILCTKKCGNRSSRYEYIEKSILTELEELLKSRKVEINNEKKNSNIQMHEKQLINAKKELDLLNVQKTKIFDSYELGVYDSAVFLERSNYINNQINESLATINNLTDLIEKEKPTNTKNEIIQIKNTIDAYRKSTNIKTQNELMKSILIKVEYTKTHEQRDDNFKIKLFPRLLR